MSIFSSQDLELIRRFVEFRDLAAILAFVQQARLLFEAVPIVGKPDNLLCAVSSDNINIQFTNKVIIKADFSRKKRTFFSYILPENALQDLQNKYPDLKEAYTFEEMEADNTRPKSLIFNFENFDFEDIKEDWLNTARTAFASYKVSAKDKFNHELYRLITDDIYQKEILEEAGKQIENPDFQSSTNLFSPSAGKPKTMQYHPLNQILFGPAGTGKTYNAVHHTVAILENKSLEEVKQEAREEVKNRFDEYLACGRVQFVTFHQNFAYEDFIEGIKPIVAHEQIGYEIQDGIFKKMCVEALFAVYDTAVRGKPSTISFDLLWLMFIENLRNEKGFPYVFSAKNNEKVTCTGVTESNTLIFDIKDKIHTFELPQARARLLYVRENIKDLFDEFENVNPILEELKLFEQMVRAKNTIPNEIKSEHLSYKIKKNLALSMNSFWVNADTLAASQKYVLIIDEINRGNVAQIFGELITLIEESKRAGKEENLSLLLPYSKTAFSVPANLHIIGTMNTADRSIEALDTALRRRFHFIEMPPDMDFMRGLPAVEGINLADLLQTMNDRLEILLDKDHLIGHSYFAHVRTFEDLKGTFHKNILPLLQEYFFQDFAKIGLVVGKGFLKQRAKVQFAAFGDTQDDKYMLSDLGKRRTWHFTSPEEWTAETFEL